VRPTQAPFSFIASAQARALVAGILLREVDAAGHWTKSARSRHIHGVTLPRVQPIIPTRREEPFDDPDWLFEFKYDGFRGLCYLSRAAAA